MPERAATPIVSALTSRPSTLSKVCAASFTRDNFLSATKNYYRFAAKRRRQQLLNPKMPLETEFTELMKRQASGRAVRRAAETDEHRRAKARRQKFRRGLSADIEYLFGDRNDVVPVIEMMGEEEARVLVEGCGAVLAVCVDIGKPQTLAWLAHHLTHVSRGASSPSLLERLVSDPRLIVVLIASGECRGPASRFAGRRDWHGHAHAKSRLSSDDVTALIAEIGTAYQRRGKEVPANSMPAIQSGELPNNTNVDACRSVFRRVIVLENFSPLRWAESAEPSVAEAPLPPIELAALNLRIRRAVHSARHDSGALTLSRRLLDLFEWRDLVLAISKSSRRDYGFYAAPDVCRANLRYFRHDPGALTARMFDYFFRCADEEVRGEVARLWLGMPRVDDERVLARILADKSVVVLHSALEGADAGWESYDAPRRTVVLDELAAFCARPEKAACLLSWFVGAAEAIYCSPLFSSELIDGLLPVCIQTVPPGATFDRSFRCVFSAVDRLRPASVIEICTIWIDRIESAIAEGRCVAELCPDVVEALVWGTNALPEMRRPLVARLIRIKDPVARALFVQSFIGVWSKLLSEERASVTHVVTSVGHDEKWLQVLALVHFNAAVELNETLLQSGVHCPKPETLVVDLPLPLLRAAVTAHFVPLGGRGWRAQWLLTQRLIDEIVRRPEHPLFEEALDLHIPNLLQAEGWAEFELRRHGWCETTFTAPPS